MWSKEGEIAISGTYVPGEIGWNGEDLLRSGE